MNRQIINEQWHPKVLPEGYWCLFFCISRSVKKIVVTVDC